MRLNLRKYTREYYIRGYDGYIEFSEGKISSRVIKALGYLNPQPGQLILDIGCGRGEIIRECNVKSEAVGVDFSDAFMEFARRQGQPLVKGTAIHLPFRSGAFDSVAFLEVVEHLPMDYVERCFNEIYRVLKAGGVVVVETPIIDFLLEKMLKAYLRHDESLGNFYVNWKKPKPLIELMEHWFKILKVNEDAESGIKSSINQLSKGGAVPHKRLWIVASKE